MFLLPRPFGARYAIYMFRKIIIVSTCVFALFLSLETSVLSDYFSPEETERITTPTQAMPNELTTNTWAIFDPATGVVIAGQNTDVQFPIASITKLFTAIAVMKGDMHNTDVYITHTDVATEGRSGKLRAGEHTTPYALLFPLLIESSNDSAVAIERTFGDTFAHTLSDVLSTQSLHKTSLMDTSGLSAQNVSTVSDLALFFSYIKRTYPHILDITQLYTYVGADTGYINNNPARTLDNFTGGKHGYTEEAGHTFVGTFILPHTSKEIGIVLLASEDLLFDITELLAYSEQIDN